MILHLVVDTSGSMAEWGKHLIACGVARMLEQYLRLGYGCADMKLVVWGTEAQVVEWQTDQEFPPEMFASKGTANANALIAHLEKQPGGKVVLITDGFWSQADAKALKRWKECRQPDTLRVIRVGADANPRLRGADVFAAEDLFAALDGWLEGGVA